MRFVLHFSELEIVGKGLPINYQYLVSAWLYSQMETANPVFSKWLHNDGYVANGKQFKLFTFSQLRAKKSTVTDGRLVLTGALSLQIGILAPEMFQHLIIGFYLNRKGEIADWQGGIRFTVHDITHERPIMLKETMYFRTLSPVHIAYTNERTGRKEHIHPDHKMFEPLLLGNLRSKYEAIPGNKVKEFDKEQFSIRVIGKEDPRSRLITIKEGRKDESKLKAFTFFMELKAPPELMQVAYHAGLGQKNSMGFGMLGMLQLEEINNQQN